MKEIKIYSSKTCCKCNMIKNFLNNEGIAFTNKDVGEEENLNFLREINVLTLPVIVCDDATIVDPTISEMTKIINYAEEN